MDPKKCVGYVDWALLLLVGSALGLSKAIANSGLAGYAGNAIRESGMSASASLYIIYGFTMVGLSLHSVRLRFVRQGRPVFLKSPLIFFRCPRRSFGRVWYRFVGLFTALSRPRTIKHGASMCSATGTLALPRFESGKNLERIPLGNGESPPTRWILRDGKCTVAGMTFYCKLQ